MGNKMLIVLTTVNCFLTFFMVDSLTLYQLTFFTYLEDDGAFDFLLFLRNSIWLGNNYFLEIKFVFVF